jgi:hypothetical protein
MKKHKKRKKFFYEGRLHGYTSAPKLPHNPCQHRKQQKSILKLLNFKMLLRLLDVTRYTFAFTA